VSEDGHRFEGEGLEDVAAPTGAQPDPDHPGWFSWGDFPRSSFAAATGRLLFRPAGPGRGEVRMFPTDAHMNMGGSIHGGAVMSFIDMALFAGGRCAGMSAGHYVTLDLTTHFLARGEAGVPLDARVELVRQTRGHAFLQGVCVQGGEPCYSFTGTLKRIRAPNGPSR
jgi:acyl-coenzyme A thioesterase 13